MTFTVWMTVLGCLSGPCSRRTRLARFVTVPPWPWPTVSVVTAISQTVTTMSDRPLFLERSVKAFRSKSVVNAPKTRCYPIRRRYATKVGHALRITDSELRHCCVLCVQQRVTLLRYVTEGITSLMARYGCPAGSIINITSATVGYYKYIIITFQECTKKADRVRCRTQTRSPEITKCNGRRNCSLSLDAFKFPENFTCDLSRVRKKEIIIEIIYTCISGNIIFYDLAFDKFYIGNVQCHHVCRLPQVRSF